MNRSLRIPWSRRPSSPPAAVSPASATRRLVATLIDLALGPLTFLGLIITGQGNFPTLDGIPPIVRWTPGLLWLAALVILAQRGQTPGQAVCRLVWVDETGSCARWRPLGEPTFWAAALGVALVAGWALVEFVFLVAGVFPDLTTTLMTTVVAETILAIVAATAIRRSPAWLASIASTRNVWAAAPRVKRRPRRVTRILWGGSVLSLGGIGLLAIASASPHTTGTTVATWASAGLAQVDQHTGQVYVLSGQRTDRDGQPSWVNNLSILDGATGVTLDTIPIGGDQPSALAVDGRSHRAFVVDMGSPEWTTEEVRTIDLDRRTVLPTATFVSNPDGNNSPGSGLGGFGCQGNAIAVDEGSGRVFAVNCFIDPDGRTAPFIALIDAYSGALLRSIRLPEPAAQLIALSRFHRVFAVAQSGDLVWALDSRTGAILRTIKVNGATQALALDATTSQIVVGSRDDGGSLVFLDGRSGRVVHRLHVGLDPVSIALSGELRRAFLLDTVRSGTQWVNVLHTIDPRQGHRLHTVVLGQSSNAAPVVGTRSRRVFVLNAWDTADSGNGTVSVIDADTGALIRTEVVGTFPLQPVLAERRGHIFVPSGAAYTDSRIERVAVVERVLCSLWTQDAGQGILTMLNVNGR